MDTSTEELLFDRLALGEPERVETFLFLDRQAGLDKESAEADTFLIDRMWRSLELRHPKLGNVSLLNHSLNGLVLVILTERLGLHCRPN